MVLDLAPSQLQLDFGTDDTERLQDGKSGEEKWSDRTAEVKKVYGVILWSTHTRGGIRCEFWEGGALVQRRDMGEVLEKHGKRWSRGGVGGPQKGEKGRRSLCGTTARPRLGGGVSGNGGLDYAKLSLPFSRFSLLS